MASTAIPVRTTSKFPAIWCRPMRSAVRLNSAGRFAIGMDWQLDCGDTFAVRHEHDPSERLLSAFPSKDTSGNDTLGMPYACAYWFRILDSLGTCTRCCPELFVWKMLCTLHNWRHRSEIRRQCRRTPGTNDVVIPLCSNHFDRCCPPGISHRPMVWSNCSIDVRAMQAMLSYLTTNSWNPNPANVGIAKEISESIAKETVFQWTYCNCRCIVVQKCLRIIAERSTGRGRATTWGRIDFLLYMCMILCLSHHRYL